MRPNKKKKSMMRRLLTVLTVTLLSVLLLTFTACLGLYIYAAVSVDEAEDAMQFDANRYSRQTRFFYDEDPSDAQYTPIEWKEARPVGGERRLWVPIDEIPDTVKGAFLATEDRRFYQHDGVDLLRTLKASVNYLFRLGGHFGGSSITQQVVKNISGDKDRSPLRKVREIYRALQLEKRYSKDDILEMYLNILPLGHNIGGVGAAAEAYFGKTVDNLTVAEVATLAAMTVSPARYDPYTNMEANEKRRKTVLYAMEREGYLTKEAREAAESEEIHLEPLAARETHVHSWYIDAVIRDVTDALVTEKGFSRESASNLLYHGGLSIYTCVDKAVQSTLESYFQRDGYFSEEAHYAMTVLSARSGDVAGIVGREGVKRGNRLLDYATAVKRPPGSAIKPLSVYAPALAEHMITFGSVLDDVPVSMTKTKSGSYRMWPHNTPLIYQGLCDMKDALAYSKNTVAVKLFERLGAEESYHYLVNKFRVGGVLRQGKDASGNIATDLAAAPLALGQLTRGATLLDMTAAYGCFLDGTYRTPRTYLAVYAADGTPLLERTQEKERVLSEADACIMTQLLSGVVSYGTASSVSLKQTVDTAGKTGTSSHDKDRWFIGYTPYYVAGILCTVRDEEKGTLDSAAPTHLDAWDHVMKELHEQALDTGETTSFRLQGGVRSAVYCRDSGMLPSDACLLDPRGNRLAVGYFTSEQLHSMGHCTCHTPMLYDEEGEGVVFDHEGDGDFRPISLLKIENRDFPSEVLVRDAEYVCRELGDHEPSLSENAPYFASVIKSGRFIGVTRVGARPYNALSRRYDPLFWEEKETKEETESEKKTEWEHTEPPDFLPFFRKRKRGGIPLR